MESPPIATHKLYPRKSLSGSVVETSLFGDKINTLPALFLLDANRLFMNHTTVLKAIFPLHVQWVTTELFAIAFHEKAMRVLDEHPVEVRSH